MHPCKRVQKHSFLRRLALSISFLLSPVLFQLALAPVAAAQITTAQVSGNVVDSQGLSVPGARIVLRQQATGQTFQAMTNESGDYVASSLPIGAYSLTVEHSGFKQYSNGGIVLTANQVARIDIRLEVGLVTETVEVTTKLTPVNTSTGTLDTMIDDRRLVDLPLNGRNVLSLVSLSPGVTRAALDNGPSFSQQRININGARSYSTNMMLDGATMYYAHRGMGLIQPPPDAIQEIKVITSGVNAEFGRGSAIISTVTRSGTNEFHGSLWDYFRNDVFDARSFFSTRVPKLRYNQFGGTVGGPIRHNKAFFFVSYQGLESRADIVRSSAFPPTADERRGDFSRTRGTPPRDPLTGIAFPGGIIPSSRLDPVAQKLAAKFPLPNRADGTYVTQISVPTSDWMVLGRVDYDFTPSDRTSFRYFIDNPATDNPFPAASTVDGYASSSVSNRTQTATLSHIHTFRSNLLLNARGSFTRFIYSESNNVRQTLADLGSKFITGGGPGSLPLLTISGRMGAQSAREGPRIGETIEVGADMSWSRGKHEVKFGGAFQRIFQGGRNSGRSYGEFTFNGAFTGNPMADFFLGSASELRQESQFSSNSSYESHGYYLQDRWRATSRLTLNFGLRWEVYTPWREANGKLGAFVPGARSQLFPTAPAGLVYQGDREFPLQLDAVNPGPRFSFAYDVFGNGKTSLRGGYGISYDPLISHVGGGFNVPPFAADLLITNVGPLTDPQRNVQVPYGKPFDPNNPQFLLPITLSKSFVGEIVIPYGQNINLTLEHEVFRDTLLQASYVSMLGRKIPVGPEQNPAVYIPGQSTLRNTDQRRIFAPAFGSVANAFSTSGVSSYHALQIVGQKRFSKGYTLQVAYSYAKAIDEAGTSEVADNWFLQNPSNRRADRGLGFDIRNRLVASGLWELPIFRSQKTLVGKALGGWQLAGILNVQDGTPFTVVSGVDRSLQGVGRDRPDLLGDPKLSSDRPKADRLARYFDTSKFALNREGQFGSAGRNILIGPGSANVALSMQKVFAIMEQKTLHFRWDVFNALNRANFGNPGTNLSSSGSFGRITSAGSGRVMQFSLTFKF